MIYEKEIPMRFRKSVLRFFCLTLFVLAFVGDPKLQTLRKEVFAERRAKLMDQMESGMAVFKNPAVSNRNSDVDYPYRAGSDFYYLTGFEYPSSAFILDPNGEKKFIMFVEEKSTMVSLVRGEIPGIEGAMTAYGADTAYAIDRLEEMLRRSIRGKDKIHFDVGNKDLFETIHSLLPQHGRRPNTLADVLPIIHEMRLIKGPEEIELLQKSITITCDAHIEVMRAAKPGMFEYELGAVIDYVYKKNGSLRKGFPSIIGSGPRTSVFHYDANNHTIQDGDLVLLDIGAEYGFYSADVTRTIPINGKFTKEQKEIYELVLAAQEAAIKVLVPGKGCRECFEPAEEVIREGLYRLGLITDKDSPWQTQAFYYPLISHWLGLDAHDVGDYGNSAQGGRPLEPGMVVTIEPGLYFGETMLTVFREMAVQHRGIAEEEVDAFLNQIHPVLQKYKNIGIRIEDDILITEDGNRNLSAKAPKTVKDIETMMKQKSRFE
jgi:Xaa-Pro aminopeptidase